MNSSNHGKQSSVSDWLDWFIIGGLTTLGLVLVVMFALLFGGCASYPKPLPAIEQETLIKPLEVSYEVASNPKDQESVTVKVGEMRKALVVAERYEMAVVSQNLAVEQAELLLEDRELANERIEEAERIGLWNAVLVGFSGVLLGGAIIGVLGMIAR